MPRSGNGTLTPEEVQDHLFDRTRAEQAAVREISEAAGEGWRTGGVDSHYPGEWDFDLATLKHRLPDGTSSELPIGECPDEIPLTEHGQARYAVDAIFVEGVPHKQTGRMRASTLRRSKRITDVSELKSMREAQGIKTMREDYDPFAYGYSGILGRGGATAQYLPLWPGPVTRQLYWADYFAMSAKAFEAYNHDPVSWRCVHMKQEFALGKGLQARITKATGSDRGQTHDKAQAAWEEFWKRNKMDARFDMLARDLSWGGEQFLRYFSGTGANARKLTVRTLDPASIYDLITDPEDPETVFAYHQQFQTAYQLYAPGGTAPPKPSDPSPYGPTDPGATTRFIIRQILPQDVDHYKINQSAYERRGRSDLFPALGWIKRLRDYLVSHVIRADMLSRIVWDLKVEGNAAAVGAARQKLFPNNQPPPPGGVFGHNSAAELSAIAPQLSGSQGRWDPVLDALVGMVANSIGLPQDWLGFGMGSTRAGALVATEPAARSLEDLQGLIELILHDCFDRVMAAARITDAEAEFTFPSIATEDRTSKLKDLAFAESAGWVSKKTSASIAAKELGITGYDFDEEQRLIAQEFEQPADTETDTGGEPNPVTGEPREKPVQGDGVVRRPMLPASYRQAPKLDPTKAVSSEDEPPGLLVPADGSSPEDASNGNGPSAPGRSGIPKDENPLSGEGAENIRQDNTAVRERFTAEDIARATLIGVREAARRRPDDPAFRRAAERYRTETASNVAELVGHRAGTEPESRE